MFVSLRCFTDLGVPDFLVLCFLLVVCCGAQYTEAELPNSQTLKKNTFGVPGHQVDPEIELKVSGL